MRVWSIGVNTSETHICQPFLLYLRNSYKYPAFPNSNFTLPENVSLLRKKNKRKDFPVGIETEYLPFLPISQWNLLIKIVICETPDFPISWFCKIYFNVRKFRVQKISRVSRMAPQFAKLNGREKNLFADSRKLIPTKQFSHFLGHFLLTRT